METPKHIFVRAYPAAKSEHVELRNDKLYIYVREPASQGLANRRVGQLVADYYGVEAKKLRIISGHTTQNKIFTVMGE